MKQQQQQQKKGFMADSNITSESRLGEKQIIIYLTSGFKDKDSAVSEETQNDKSV